METTRQVIIKLTRGHDSKKETRRLESNDFSPLELIGLLHLLAYDVAAGLEFTPAETEAKQDEPTDQS